MRNIKKTGLFFGSFNPIHNGHLIIANYIIQYTDIDEVLFILSPQNPFKTDDVLLDSNIRYELLSLSLENNLKIRPCDIELNLGVPSYTIQTLTELKKNYPEKTFSLIIGSDNVDDFDKWKDYEKIFDLTDIYVYPRPGEKPTKFISHKKMKFINAPLIEISSSEIRNMIKNDKDPRYFIPEKAYFEIMNKQYYNS